MKSHENNNAIVDPYKAKYGQVDWLVHLLK